MSMPLDGTTPTTTSRSPLRLYMRAGGTHGGPDGVWWPRSRYLEAEVGDLVQHLPETHGHVAHVLFSRPDWDDALVDGRGASWVPTGSGGVKVGSFASDDTRLVILTMTSGQRLRLTVLPSDTEPTAAQVLIEGVDDVVPTWEADRAWDIWDNETPSS
jgi:hypothetical protein